MSVFPPQPSQPAGHTAADRIAALEAQIKDLQEAQAAAAAAPPAPDKPKRALPSVGELVTHTYETAPGSGLYATRRGLVVALDAERDPEHAHALVNWLPDATADMVVDDLDPPPET